ncbi:MAG TPA: hypothetical protein EYP56_05665 [Planctomycetaceae bacterium]|nr:hypothetical protein [Planctomycetaceae bacterium]
MTTNKTAFREAVARSGYRRRCEEKRGKGLPHAKTGLAAERFRRAREQIESPDGLLKTIQ